MQQVSAVPPLHNVCRAHFPVVFAWRQVGSIQHSYRAGMPQEGELICSRG